MHNGGHYCCFFDEVSVALQRRGKGIVEEETWSREEDVLVASGSSARVHDLGVGVSRQRGFGPAGAPPQHHGTV